MERIADFFALVQPEHQHIPQIQNTSPLQIAEPMV